MHLENGSFVCITCLKMGHRRVIGCSSQAAGCRILYMLQASLEPSDLQLSQLKAFALRSMCEELSGLHLYLPELIKLPRLEYLEVQSATIPSYFRGFCNTVFAYPQWDEQVHPSRPFMLAMSQSKGISDMPDSARVHAWHAEQSRHREAAAKLMEQVFGPQDRNGLVHGQGVDRMLQYVPLRHQDLDMEIVYYI